MRYAAGNEWTKADDMRRFASKTHALAYAVGYVDGQVDPDGCLAHDGAVVLKRRWLGGWKRIARVG